MCGRHCSHILPVVSPLELLAELNLDSLSVSEITVSTCLFPPSLGEDLCGPDSTSEDDALKGKWVRVARDLNLEAGMSVAYLVCSSFFTHSSSAWVNEIVSISTIAGRGEQIYHS
jgi:hypothetical protein